MTKTGIRAKGSDRLEAMIRQEEKFYQCEDYLETTDQPETSYSPLHVVAEMASLVTDYRFVSTSEKDSSPIISSAQSVSPSSSTADLSMLSHKATSRKSCFELPLVSTWRQQIHEWISSVVDALQLDRDTTAVAFSILDRFMAVKSKKSEIITREDFQLYSMVSIYISVKMSAAFRKLSLKNLVEMSHSQFEPEQITKAELEILKEINWHVNPPTTMTFCNHYLELYSGGNSARIYNSCRYFSDLSLADDFFISKPSSRIALGIVLLVMQREGVPFIESQRFLENLTGLIQLQSDEFDIIYQRLESLC